MADLFIEALDTIHHLGWALLVWILLLALVTTLALYTITATVLYTCRTLWRAWRWTWHGTRGPTWAYSRARARWYARRRRAQDYREAA